ncbi:MAG: tetratricopeptide repeat protein [Nitrospirota bacterium]
MWIVLLAAALVFSLSLANGFVWDDDNLILSNDVYRRFDIGAMFMGMANNLEYLPVRDLSLALDAQIWGMKPFGFHLTNLLLYLAGLWALFSMVRELFLLFGQEGRPAAFWTTLVFALHPLHAEVVNFVSARNTLLAGLFLFLSAAFMFRGLREKRNLFIAPALILYLAAVFSKAIAVFFPVFLLVVIILLPRDRRAFRLQTMALLGCIAITAVAVRIHTMNAADTGIMDDEILRFGTGSRLLTLERAVLIPFFYIRMFLFPYPLSVEYTPSFVDGASPVLTGAALFVLCAILAVAWLIRQRRPLVTLGIAWSLASLIPVLNLFPTHPVVADRYAYFAVAGFGLLCAAVMTSSAGSRTAALYSALAVLFIWMGIDVSRTLDWRSDITLWSSAIAADQKTSRINIAQALWTEGRYDEALNYLREERQRKGTHFASLYEGMLLMQEGHLDEAILAFRRSLREGGDSSRKVWMNLAIAYEKKGDAARALENYLKVLQTKSIDPNGWFEQASQAGLTRIRSQFAQRVEMLRERAKSLPADFEAQSSAAIMLQSLGLYEEAEKYYHAAVALNSSSWGLWYNLALTHMQRGQYADAARSFEKALVLKPGDTGILNNLGSCAMHLKDYHRAEQAYRQALELDPGFLNGAFNLGRLYFIIGDPVRSRELFGRARVLAASDSAIQSRIDLYLNSLGDAQGFSSGP